MEEPGDFRPKNNAKRDSKSFQLWRLQMTANPSKPPTPTKTAYDESINVLFLFSVAGATRLSSPQKRHFFLGFVPVGQKKSGTIGQISNFRSSVRPHVEVSNVGIGSDFQSRVCPTTDRRS